MGVIMTDTDHLYVHGLPDHLLASEGNPDNHTHIVYKRSSSTVPASEGTSRPGHGKSGCGVEGLYINISFNIKKFAV